MTNTDSILKAQITFWHKATIRAHLIDYSQDGSSTPEGTVFNPRVPGPCYVSRAFAMVHIAMFDAYVGITRSQRTYLAYKTPLPRVEKSAPPTLLVVRFSCRLTADVWCSADPFSVRAPPPAPLYASHA